MHILTLSAHQPQIMPQGGEAAHDNSSTDVPAFLTGSGSVTADPASTLVTSCLMLSTVNGGVPWANLILLVLSATTVGSWSALKP